ncbi:FYVE, RhoGEF and PH domain-containing protein 6 [Clupea harengus]|uniref:FYVE, RhoGEF and PH domain-containing protein 6 n=1 Tax=Clupea harengus TaxID=7950 RepID=A0A6P8GUM3_CLUHA|nr:FYVE, RhoGEF and PH domain-containing protein 6 [Clupea harengus]
MSSGVKKPPVAPKPKVKPPPPPIAPKPDPLRLQPSPAATKRPKPALAPKPCPSKTSSNPPPKSSIARVPPNTHTPPSPRTAETTPHTLPDTLHLLNSKNDAQSPQSSRSTHTRYIINTCVCGESTCEQCHRLGNGGDTHLLLSLPGQNGGEEVRGRRKDEEGEQNGGVVADLTHTPIQGKDRAHTPTGIEDVTHTRTDMEQTAHTPTNPPQTLHSMSADCSHDSPTQNHTHSPLPHTHSPLPQTRTRRRRSPNTPSPEHTPTDTPSPLQRCLSRGEVRAGSGSPQCECDISQCVCDVSRCVCDVSRCMCREKSVISPVPAPPSKPLPKPIPRRPRRVELKRQDGLDTQLTHTSANTHADTQTHTEVHGNSETRTHTDEPLQHASIRTHTDKNAETHTDMNTDTHIENDVETQTQEDAEVCNVETLGNHGDTDPSESIYHTPVDDVDDDDPASIPPVPPPRQKSLSHKTSSSLDNLLEHRDARGHAQGEEEEDGAGDDDDDNDDEDNEGGDEGCYGDFARYPITRSLPKQIKFRCVPRSVSAEERSPRIAPRKPQRHSMPAKHTVALAPEHTHSPVAITTFPELPAPPQDKPAWRLPLPTILFGRNQQSRASTGSSQSQSVKQRARSFSSADLAARLEGSDSPKRSSFRKLLELRMSVRMLPRLLIKSSQSLDCTSAQTEIYADAMKAKSKAGLKAVTNGQGMAPGNSMSPGDSSLDGQGTVEEESEVEYENVPLYEEIPEYMNLPLYRLSWNAPLSEDVYEVQEPYKHKGKDNRVSGGSSLQQEEEVSSDEGDDSSSASSKGDLNQSEDKQHEQEMKRNKVVHIATEIMSSEKVFVDVLKLLHIDFRDAVAKATRQSGKPVIEERVLNQILYYLPQLYELNKDLLKELEERVAHWTEHQSLADIFVQKGPYLKMYSTYIKEFDHNIALLDEQCRKNPTFHSVLRDFEMSPRCANLALKHYLLKPVQRIPQYQLLLTDYLKNLPEDSTDYKDTQTALGIVKEVANHANDIMKQGDNFQKLMQIQYSLNGHHEIVQPGRVFLKEGTLMKLSRKIMQPRMFFLFNDAVLYTTPVQSGQYKLNCMLSLAGMKVSKPSQEAYQNELNIESVERSFILSASSATERDEWLEAISKAIEDFTRKKITFISSRSQEENERVAGDDSDFPLGSKAPIWIPDLRTTMCMICTCEFTLTWRRHHCRACGKVVCQACSSNKCYLEYLKHQLARVCDHCYVKLQHKSDHSASSSISPGGRAGSSAFSFSRKQKKIPSALKEVSASTENSSMSGYLMRSKGHKKPWRRLWFVIKNKVLYTYAASEDVAALESQPLLGFFLREEKTGPAQKLQFKLYHKNTLYYIFKAEDIPTAQRWIEAFQEAMIL